MVVVDVLLVVINVILMVQYIHMIKFKELLCYVDFVQFNKILIIYVHIVRDNLLKELIKVGIGKVDLDVEIRICYRRKMRRNILGLLNNRIIIKINDERIMKCISDLDK